MKKIALLFLIAFGCTQKQELVITVSPSTAEKEIKGDLTNAENQLEKPYVILVSIDGFRYDYAKRYGATNLLNFDVKAEKMIPSFPSKTFPNHYAIVSGLYPGHNGLVSNSFYDTELELAYSIGNRSLVENPKFYNGTPLWVLASENNMVNASMFWVGSEAPIKGKFPTYYYKYDGDINYEDRVNQTVKWLQLPANERPHLITLYFSITDDLGHKYGPNSKEIEQGVKDIDSTIGDLVSKLNKLDLDNVNIIVVSDHGMLEVDLENLINLEELIPSDMNMTQSFPAMIYSDNSERVDSLYQSLAKDTSRFNVYLKTNLPEGYHYNANLSRIGDLVLMPKPPYAFKNKSHTLSKGASTHGFDPKYTPEMGAIFYAKGPAFIKQENIAPFENVHVYPLISKILELDFDKESIDGNIEILLPILK